MLGEGIWGGAFELGGQLPPFAPPLNRHWPISTLLTVSGLTQETPQKIQFRGSTKQKTEHILSRDAITICNWREPWGVRVKLLHLQNDTVYIVVY